MAMILYSGKIEDENIKLFMKEWENKFSSDRVRNELFDILNSLKNGEAELTKDAGGRIWVHKTEYEGNWLCFEPNGGIEIGFPHA